MFANGIIPQQQAGEQSELLHPWPSHRVTSWLPGTGPARSVEARPQCTDTTSALAQQDAI